MRLHPYAGLAFAILGGVLATESCSSDCPNCPGAPARVVISPNIVSVLPGDSVPLDAEVLDGAGRLLAGHPVTWELLDPAFASLRDTAHVAIVRGLAVGGARVVAARGGLADTNVVSVVITSTFAAQVSPILRRTCALGGCHVTGGVPLDLSVADTTIRRILTEPGNKYTTPGDTAPHTGQLLTRLRGDTTPARLIMPPQGRLDSVAPADYHLISRWIVQGAAP